MTWQESVKNAEHYKALGQTKIYLSEREDGGVEALPWKFVTGMEPGGSYRYGMSVSVHFTATHPSGLTFSWSIDAETPRSNGTFPLQFDTDRMQVVRKLLKGKPKVHKEFLTYLATCAVKLREQAQEYVEATARMEKVATELEKVA